MNLQSIHFTNSHINHMPGPAEHVETVDIPPPHFCWFFKCQLQMPTLFLEIFLTDQLTQTIVGS